MFDGNVVEIRQVGCSEGSVLGQRARESQHRRSDAVDFNVFLLFLFIRLLPFRLHLSDACGPDDRFSLCLERSSVEGSCHSLAQ